jgi:hypothetical protein
MMMRIVSTPEASEGTLEEKQELEAILRFAVNCRTDDMLATAEFAKSLPESNMPMWAKLICAQVYVADMQDRDGFKEEWTRHYGGKS